MHGDHCFGLPGLLCTLSGNNPVTRTELDIYGPIGLKKFLRASLSASDSHLGFLIKIHEVVPIDLSEEDLQKYVTELPQALECEKEVSLIRYESENHCFPIARIANLTIRSAPLQHRVFSMGYVIEEDSVPGKLDAKLLQEKHGIKPGPIFGKLKSGKDVVLDDQNKTVVRSSDFMGPDQKGRKVCILGDSCDSSGLAYIARDCDAITHESTLEDGQKDLCIMKGHSTPNMAATFAKDINAKRLILTHFSARYLKQPEEGNPNVANVSILLEQAKQVFDNVELADDFKEFTVKRTGEVA
ncbi:zinc phosphodiesterase ELAC protein [Acrasis kona]